MPVIVMNVKLIEFQILNQIVHVQKENSQIQLVLLVTTDVLNVPLTPIIVLLVPKTESMLQNVFVHLVIMMI
jgi:hypothetical protein